MRLTIMNLPVEILMLIFGYFSVVQRARTVAQVCSSWRVLCQAPLFWTDVTLPHLCRSSNGIQAYRRLLAQHADHIRTLHVQDQCCEMSDIFYDLHFPYLKTIRLYYLSVDFARALVKACPAVENLMVYCQGQDMDIDVFHILCMWRHLRRVDVACELDGSGGDRVYAHLFQTCEHLEWVDLYFGHPDYFNDQGVHLLAQHHCTTLSRLAVISDSVTTLAPLLDCHQLTHLQLHVSHHVPDKEIIALQVLPKLTHLELNNYHPSSLGLCRFFNRKLKLTDLLLYDMDITTEVMTGIAASCSQLQFLYIDCHSITNEMVMALFDCTHQLHSLALWGDMHVTEDIFQQIPSKLPQLKRLFLRNQYKTMVRRLLPTMDVDTPLVRSWFHYPHYYYSPWFG